jgi:hypothetical protein
MDFNLEGLDFEKLEAEFESDFKIVYDIFYLYFLDIFAIKDREEYVKTLSKSQCEEIIKWVSKYPLPFYEKKEEYEKCAQLKEILTFIKEKKKI